MVVDNRNSMVYQHFFLEEIYKHTKKCYCHFVFPNRYLLYGIWQTGFRSLWTFGIICLFLDSMLLFSHNI